MTSSCWLRECPRMTGTSSSQTEGSPRRPLVGIPPLALATATIHRFRSVLARQKRMSMDPEVGLPHRNYRTCPFHGSGSAPCPALNVPVGRRIVHICSAPISAEPGMVSVRKKLSISLPGPARAAGHARRRSGVSCADHLAPGRPETMSAVYAAWQAAHTAPETPAPYSLLLTQGPAFGLQCDPQTLLFVTEQLAYRFCQPAQSPRVQTSRRRRPFSDVAHCRADSRHANRCSSSIATGPVRDATRGS